MINSKRIKKLLVISVLALLASTVYYVAKTTLFENTNQHRSADRVTDFIAPKASDLVSHGAGIRTSLITLMKREAISEAELSKVDFSLPGDATYGDNPRLEIFNPAGLNQEPITKTDLAPLLRDPRFIITAANRIEGVGGPESDLVAVFPEPYEDICERINLNGRATNLAVYKQEIDLTPFPDTPPKVPILKLSPDHTGCIATTQGRYYVHTIYAR